MGQRIVAMFLALACGACLPAAQDLTKAEELYNRTDYERSLALLDKNSSDAAVNFLIGRDLFMTGNFKGASEAFEKAIQARPSNSEYFDWLGRAYGRRAETSNPLMAPAWASRARQAFEKSVQLDPKNG